MNLYSSSALFFGTLNQYSGLIFFLPYDMSGVDLEIGLNIGLPIRSRKYSGGSSEGLAGRGISSENRTRSFCQLRHEFKWRLFCFW